MSNISSPVARMIVREWAKLNEIEIADRGAIKESVREAYIKAHEGDKAFVIESEPNTTYKGYRLITVMCPLCANMHTHGAENAARGDIGHRIGHCWNAPGGKRGGYQIEDNTPVNEWENR